MTIADARFGAEILNSNGKVYKFDDIKCLSEYLSEHEIKGPKIYFVNYSRRNHFIEQVSALLFYSEDLRSPMGGNIAAFEDEKSLTAGMYNFSGHKVQWQEVLKLIK
jgi:copper chaperone NosL